VKGALVEAHGELYLLFVVATGDFESELVCAVFFVEADGGVDNARFAGGSKMIKGLTKKKIRTQSA